MRIIPLRHVIAIVTAFLLGTIGLQADLKPATKVVAQEGAPIKITSYSARYVERSQYTAEGIHHFVKFQNAGTKDVDAVQFGLVSFDLWNEFLDRTQGIATKTIPVGKAESGTWVATALSDFSFLTGVAYVNRVRFADGTIWIANMDAVLEELRKIETDFDAARLKKPETEPKK